MRVVAGSARGIRLSGPPGGGTRPTADRVKEACFNALDSMGAVADARVLDAFAGSGGLGIEALSRGAAHCTFVERDARARAAVEANLAATGLADRALVVAGDVGLHLARADTSFHLVLLDPPHATADWAGLLAVVAPRLADDPVVVVESDAPVVDDGTDSAWTVIRQKRYGGTVVQMLVPGPGPGGDE